MGISDVVIVVVVDDVFLLLCFLFSGVISQDLLLSQGLQFLNRLCESISPKQSASRVVQEEHVAAGVEADHTKFWSLAYCAPPLLQFPEDVQLLVSGLGNTARWIVNLWDADSGENFEGYKRLLGLRINGQAEVNAWLRFCEIQAPRMVEEVAVEANGGAELRQLEHKIGELKYLVRGELTLADLALFCSVHEVLVRKLLNS